MLGEIVFGRPPALLCRRPSLPLLILLDPPPVLIDQVLGLKENLRFIMGIFGCSAGRLTSSRQVCIIWHTWLGRFDLLLLVTI